MNQAIILKNDNPVFKDMLSLMARLKDLKSVSELLSYDQETAMPVLAVMHRSGMIATVDSIYHGMLISSDADRIANGLLNIKTELSPHENRLADLFIEEHEKASKVPIDFVNQMSIIQSRAVDAWNNAKHNSSYPLFMESLSAIVDIKRKHAEYLSNTDNPYDALIEIYNPNNSFAELSVIFNEIETRTKKLLKKIDFERQDYQVKQLFSKSFTYPEKQKISENIASRLGFDFARGTLNDSAHPFTTGFSTNDVRITSKISSAGLLSCIFALIHESGHGMYEQGFSSALHGTFASDGSSCAMHEAQALFWENIIARSREFSDFLVCILREHFVSYFNSLQPDALFRYLNIIKPGTSRIEADELTYNLHVILRFEIENALINGKINVKDIPEIWNEKMRDKLGIVPHSDSEGCLQDIHWSCGLFAYFPSYTLGKLISASLYNSIKIDIPDLHSLISQGDFAPIRNWFYQKVYFWGKIKSTNELLRDLNINPKDTNAFFDYINSKIKLISK